MPASDLCESAIYEELRSRDEAGIIACQEDNCLSDLFRLPHTIERDTGGDEFPKSRLKPIEARCCEPLAGCSVRRALTALESQKSRRRRD